MVRMGVTLAGLLLPLSNSAGAGQSVSFTWRANTEPNLAGYRVYYGVASRAYTQVLNVGLTNRATVSNLTPGTTYYFALVAYNTLGLESGYTSELSYSVPVPPEPRAVLRISVTSTRRTVLTVTGPTNRTYSIEASSDLKNWSAIASVTTDSSGVSVFSENNPPSRTRRFYRARGT